VQQPVHFAHTSDGVTIAFGSVGSGRPLLLVPGWISHAELDLENPQYAQFVEALSNGGRRRIIRLDMRGTGLSDRDVDDTSVFARARDIEAVVDQMGLESVPVFAWSMGGPPAIVYAAEHPEKVSHLMLHGSLAHSSEIGREALGRALVDLIRADWRIGARAIIEFVYPNAEKEVVDSFTYYARNSASGEVAADILEEALFGLDVRDQLSRLTMPTLVTHRRDDQAFPMNCGRDLASLLPHAHFMALPGNTHAPFYGDIAPVIGAVNDFLATSDGHAHSEAGSHELQPLGVGGLQTILFTDMENSTSMTQQMGDADAQELVRAHNAIVRDALRAHGGSEIKHTGDGIMAAFPSAARAIDCAIVIQRGCDSHALEHPTAPLRMRIGLNAGEPVAEERDLFGAAVQLAARVCTSAGPGQILASDVVRQLAAGKRFLWSDQGHVALRGFEDPVRLYEVKWRS